MFNDSSNIIPRKKYTKNVKSKGIIYLQPLGGEEEEKTILADLKIIKKTKKKKKMKI